MEEISVAELHARRSAGDDLVVLDVREPDELTLAALPGTLDIPMGQIADRLDEIPRERDVVVLCHSGQRSARVTKFLAANGFERVANVRGGIDAWACEIDPAVARY
jgi:rhodanese-related sulfurtransferase